MAGTSYSLSFTDGRAQSNVMNGTYSTVTNSTGYTETTNTLTVSSDADNYTINVAADGTLTLHVTEQGTAEGTAITTATFYRTDGNGITHYGTAHSPDASGNVVFEFVPHYATNPPNIYIVQTASDGKHLFSTALQTYTLTASTGTEQVQNALPNQRTFFLIDENYPELSVATGSSNLTST